jgi:hypothetical protein
VDRSVDLRADYDRLGVLLAVCDPSAAAGIARERRMISELLVSLERPLEVPLVDQLASRRQSKTSAVGAASRRRKSG